MGPFSSNTGLGRIIASDILTDAVMAPGMRVITGYTIVYILEGLAGYWDSRFTRAALRPGDLLFVFPNHPHHYNAQPGGHWKQICFWFDSPMFDLWIKIGLLDPARPIHHVEPVDYWFKRFNAVRPKAPMVEVLELQQIIAEALIQEEAGALPQHDLEWAKGVCSILEENIEKNISNPRLAKRMGHSYDYLRKRFARIMGQSPLQYRNRCLVDRACRLMQETNLTNKEITYRLGFCDEFHFSHRFKQLTGRSPREFRRTLPRTGKRGEFTRSRTIPPFGADGISGR